MNVTGTINATVTNITPAFAKKVLDEQANLPEHRQRRLHQSRIGQYAREMANGAWKLNGEPIQFNGSRLLNGQHRMHAVIKAGVSVPMLVVRGVSPEAFDTIDQGKSRSVNDLLDIHGVSYRNEAASAGRLALTYERHGLSRPKSLSDRVVAREVAEYAITNGEALAAAASLAYKCNVAHRQALTALFFLGRNRPELIQFSTDLRDGVNLQKDQAVRLLRDRLLLNAMTRAKLDLDVVFALCIKAWNATILQKPIGLLRFGKAEEYPVMIR